MIYNDKTLRRVLERHILETEKVKIITSGGTIFNGFIEAFLNNKYHQELMGLDAYLDEYETRINRVKTIFIYTNI